MDCELSTDFCKSTTLTGTYTVNLQCIKIPGEVSIGDFKMHKRSVLQMLSNSLDKWDYRIPGHKYWDVIPTFPSTLKKLPPNKWSICHPPFLPLEKKLPKKLPGPLGVYINRSGRYNTSAFGRSRPNSYFLVVGHGRLFDSPRERGGTPCCIIQVQPQILTIYCHFLCKCHCSHCCIHPHQFSLVHV
jgi:hypothetical protein